MLDDSITPNLSCSPPLLEATPPCTSSFASHYKLRGAGFGGIRIHSMRFLGLQANPQTCHCLFPSCSEAGAKITIFLHSFSLGNRLKERIRLKGSQLCMEIPLSRVAMPSPAGPTFSGVNTTPYLHPPFLSDNRIQRSRFCFQTHKFSEECEPATSSILWRPIDQLLLLLRSRVNIIASTPLYVARR